MTTVKYTVESTTAIYDVRDHGVTQLEPVGQPCCKDNHDDLETAERHLEQDSLEWVLDESFNDQTTEVADTVIVKKNERRFQCGDLWEKVYPPLGQETRKSKRAQPHVLRSNIASRNYQLMC